MKTYKVNIAKLTAPQLRDYGPGMELGMQFGEQVQPDKKFEPSLSGLLLINVAADVPHPNTGTVRVLKGTLRHGETARPAVVKYYPKYHDLVLLMVYES